MSGEMVKNHVLFHMLFGLIAMRRTAFRSWFPVFLRLLLRRSSWATPKSLPQESSSSSPSAVSVDSERADEHERGDPSSSEIPGWLQEFRENLVDERVPEPHGARVPVQGDSRASSSHEPPSEALRRVVSGNHRVYTHFPKERNCEICHRTKITRALCRRRFLESYFAQKSMIS